MVHQLGLSLAHFVRAGHETFLLSDEQNGFLSTFLPRISKFMLIKFNFSFETDATKKFAECWLVLTEIRPASDRSDATRRTAQMAEERYRNKKWKPPNGSNTSTDP